MNDEDDMRALYREMDENTMPGDDPFDVEAGLRDIFRRIRAGKATVRKGDVIRIVPENGPERVMTVARVEHYVITLADLPAEAERGS